MAVQMEVLTLESIAEVRGGLVNVMVAKALQRMAQDLEAAPDIPEWRSVVLEIRAKPHLENMELDHVSVEFVVKGKVPSRACTSVMLVRSQTNGSRQLMFNVDSADNPHQQPLPMGE